MQLIGNILWILLGGWAVALEYLIGGLLLCLTIIGIPLGLQVMKLGALGLVPFGVEVVDDNPPLSGAILMIFNIIWAIFIGIWIAITHVIAAFLLAITIIGLPFAWQHIKFAGLALRPFGKTLRRS